AYYRKRAKELADKKEKEILSVMLLLQSYMIARHHTDLCPLKEYFADIQNEKSKAMKIIKILNDDDWNPYTEKLKLMQGIVKHIIEQTVTFCDSLTISQSIALYTYVRLLYSVLIASDYYATAEF